MRSVEKSARTQEEAIQAALEELNASISDVEVKVLDEGSKGLFGLFGSRMARVKVTVKADTMEDEIDSLLKGTAAPEAKPEVREQPKPQARPFTAPSIVVGAMPSVVKAAPVKVQETAAPAAAEPVKAAKEETEAVETAEASVAPEKVEAPKAAEPEFDDLPKEEPARKPEPVRRTRNRKDAPRKPAAEKPAHEKPAREKKESAPLTSALEKPVVTMLQPEEIDPESPAGKALAFLQELTRLMGVPVTVSMGTDPDGNLYGRMNGDTLGVLIGRRGETLDALQYLTSLQVNRGQENYTRVTLDTEDYRERREDTLIRLANRMANRCIKTGRRVSLEAMNPYERRIIHSALQANDAVDTHSEGEDPNRHVVITLKR